VAIVSSFWQTTTTATTNAVLLSANTSNDISEDSIERKMNGRYLRTGSLPPKHQSVWYLTDMYGDDMEFFHFTSLSRKSFFDLCAATNDYILNTPLNCDKGIPCEHHLKIRMFDSRDIMAMTIKYLLSEAKIKDLHLQFGAQDVVYRRCIELGCAVICQELINHPHSHVHWDRSLTALNAAANRTKMFTAIPGVVGMIDGKKLESLHPSDYLEQNRDYNGWHSSVNRNLILLWDPNGKIIDAGVNLPGNFHDSKSTLWCNIYDHIESLPEGFVVVCDSAFNTGGKLKDKLVKLADAQFDETKEKSEYEKALTHLRKCSEWRNNILTGTFRRLKTKLPTDNLKRATLQWCCILMHNWRTETCDHNQIHTYFDNLERQEEV
jgi:hypothetical protein